MTLLRTVKLQIGPTCTCQMLVLKWKKEITLWKYILFYFWKKHTFFYYIMQCHVFSNSLFSHLFFFLGYQTFYITVTFIKRHCIKNVAHEQEMIHRAKIQKPRTMATWKINTLLCVFKDFLKILKIRLIKSQISSRRLQPNSRWAKYENITSKINFHGMKHIQKVLKTGTKHTHYKPFSSNNYYLTGHFNFNIPFGQNWIALLLSFLTVHQI